MAEIKYKPIRHDHDAFLKKARRRQGFQTAYQAPAVEYAVANEMLAARARAGLTQEAVASRMGTSKSTISRLESAGKHAPSLTSLKKYAKAVGCKVEIRLVPQR
jgi:DNA-binding XRE family transcriptional regulator